MSNISIIRIVEDIIDLSPQMRFAAIIDSDGDIIEAIMKEGKQSLKSQKEEENFCRQVAQRRNMRQGFDDSLGRVKYVHVEREKITQMVIYTVNRIIYFTMEPEMAMEEKIALVARVKKLVNQM